MAQERETYIVDIDVSMEPVLTFEQRRDLFEARQRTMSHIITLCVALMSIAPGVVVNLYTSDATSHATLRALWFKVSTLAAFTWISLGVSLLLAIVFLMLGPKWVKGCPAKHPVTQIMDHTYWIALLFLALSFFLLAILFGKLFY